MKKIFFLFVFAFGLTFASNNQVFELKQNDPKVGDVLIINSPSGSMYNHIDFPRLNFIVKRGGIANYKSVQGNHVVVKEVINDGDGTTRVVIERRDKSKFFGFLKDVEADYIKSIESGEISKAKS
ncbi:hypothetical protein [Mariniflexile sp.]|uniref:hypothetical protein n=1 Tax=Mariniflexile sp. TaxID=1979402 RepID=UPI004047747F